MPALVTAFLLLGPLAYGARVCSRAAVGAVTNIMRVDQQIYRENSKLARLPICSTTRAPLRGQRAPKFTSISLAFSLVYPVLSLPYAGQQTPTTSSLPHRGKTRCKLWQGLPARDRITSVSFPILDHGLTARGSHQYLPARGSGLALREAESEPRQVHADTDVRSDASRPLGRGRVPEREGVHVCPVDRLPVHSARV